MSEGKEDEVKNNKDVMIEYKQIKAAVKFRSCMQLFASIGKDPIFRKVLIKNRWV